MKTYQKYLSLLLIAIFILGSYFYLQNQKNYISKVHTVLINILNKQIENEKVQAFNFAFALSQNETLQNSLKNNNAKKGYKILQEHMHALEIFSNSKIHAQILTKDFVIFARSWDNRDAGVSVKKNRPDLQGMQKSKRPHLSFEAARKLVLIASIPIISDEKIIGYLEVIQRFKSLKKNLANYDMNLLVLLNSKYKQQAILLKNNPKIENMIVADNEANVEHIAYLQKVGISKLLNNGKLEGEHHFYFLRAILNNNGDNIGSFVLIVSRKKLELFSAFESELDSFFTYARKDLYYSINNNNNKTDVFSCFEDTDTYDNQINISRGKIK
ncbi:MAG: hypothetical protein ACI9TV_000687 [Sulfurimonas sp.]|jgi:hypothetical protein|uniref:cache domain-containing protein n=1 Tax=Sulfurimonas sp. TaxID=2022749 RepID=UPI0039E5F697